MARSIVVDVQIDGDFGRAESEARESFSRIGSIAGASESDIRAAFDGIAAGIGGSFDGIDTDARRSFSRLEAISDDAADDVVESWRRGLSGLDAEFAVIDDGLTRSLVGLGPAADRAASDVEDAFASIDLRSIDSDALERELSGIGPAAERAADRIERPFADLESEIRGEVSGISSAVESELSSITAPPGLEDRIAEPFGRGGKRGADELKEGFDAGFGQIDFSSIGSTLTSQLDALGDAGGPIAGAALAIGATFGDDLAAGFDQGFNAQRNNLVFQVTNGLSDIDLRSVGQAAGEAYADGIGDSLSGVRETAALLSNELSAVDDNFDISSATRQAEALNQVFGVQVPQSIEVARRLVANDLVADTNEAFNLIGQTAQRFRIDYQDILEVVNEFAPVFSKLGVDGAQAFEIIGQMVQRGLLPNIDRAAELFEEFNIRLSEVDTLAEPVRQLGLDFGELQAQLARGEGAEALTSIVDALLAIEDPAQRNAIALEIFGASIESAADPRQVLQLLATADGIGEIGSQADDAVAAVERSASSLELLGRGAENAGRFFGNFVEGQAAYIRGDLDAKAEADATAVASLTREVGEAAQVFSDWGLISQGVAEDLGAAGDEVAEIEGLVSGGLAEGLALGATRLTDAGQAANLAEERFASLGGNISDTADAVRDLQGALDDFSGRFDEDRIFRSIEADAAAALEATSELTGQSFSLAEGFDTSTDAGRRAEESLERLSGNLDDLIRGQQDGTISAFDLARGQADVQAAVADVARQMNITEAEAASLISKYSDIPSQVLTELLADDDASALLERIRRLTDGIPRRISVGVFGFKSGNVVIGGRRYFARGGLTEAGEIAGVGEEGPELADDTTPWRRYTPADFRASALPPGFGVVGAEGFGYQHFDRPTRIYPAAETERLLAQIPRMHAGGVSHEERIAIIGDNPNARIDPEITAPQSFIEDAMRKVLQEDQGQGRLGGARVNIEQVVVDEGRDLWAELDLYDQMARAFA